MEAEIPAAETPAAPETRATETPAPEAPVRRRKTRAETWPTIIRGYAMRGTRQALIVEGAVWALLVAVGIYTTAKVGWPWWWSAAFVTVLSGTNALRVVVEGRAAKAQEEDPE